MEPRRGAVAPAATEPAVDVAVAVPATAVGSTGRETTAPSGSGAGCVRRDRQGLCLGAHPGLDRDAALSRYLARVRRAVQRSRRYPYMAKRMGLEGLVTVRVTIDARGRSVGVHVMGGRAPQALREAALSAVRSAAPFPVLPAVLGTRLEAVVPIRFQLAAR